MVIDGTPAFQENYNHLRHGTHDVPLTYKKRGPWFLRNLYKYLFLYSHHGLGQGFSYLWPVQTFSIAVGFFQFIFSTAFFMPRLSTGPLKMSRQNSLFSSERTGLCKQLPRAFFREYLGTLKAVFSNCVGRGSTSSRVSCRHTPGAIAGFQLRVSPESLCFYSTPILESYIRFHLVLNIKQK